MITPSTRLRRFAAFAAVVVTCPLLAAENPVHTPPPREVVSPLYEGKTDNASLAPLQAWVKTRCADGTCTPEQLQRELQGALNEIHERTKQGHRIIMDDIKAARTLRENLLKEIAAARASGQPPRGLAEKIAGLPPLPTTRIWGDPHVNEAVATTTVSASSKRNAPASTAAGTASTSTTSRTITTSASSSAAPGAAGDLDAFAAKLNSDLATLTALAQQAQADLQDATTRMQQATAALANQSRAFHEAAMNAIRNMKG